MLDAVALTLIDGVRIVVPDRLDLITPYVLREQLDFFEDELPFVRTMLRPGQNVIDVGANYGVYALPMAQIVGPRGHVWAFEPASATAEFLAKGIAANAFENVTLEQSAVSSAQGSAELAMHTHAELRSIVYGAPPPGGSEKVSLVTLDDCMDRYRWRDIDLIKIDAEGEEANILKGGRRFFANLEPLVQYELRTGGANMNFDLVRDFAALGYSSYRLVRGLGVLVPFDAKASPDSYLLNLFCCNESCAERLSARGLLLRPDDLAADSRSDLLRAGPGKSYDWRHALAVFDYTVPLMPIWETAAEGRDGADVQRALALYARSRDATLTQAERFHALEVSFSRISALCVTKPSHLRLSTLARVANDYGQRAVAVSALNQLLDSIRVTGTVDRSEPFLAPLKRFDTIAPGDAFGSWLLAAVLEQLEQLERLSSFYAGASALERLEAISFLGFGSSGMERRLALVRLCIARAKH